MKQSLCDPWVDLRQSVSKESSSVSVGDACKDSKARQETTAQEVAIVKMKSSHVADDWVNEPDINNTLCVRYVHYHGGPHNI